MNKRDLQDGLKRQGEILSITEIAKYLKCDRSTVRRYLKGYDCLSIGTAKKYHYKDVADAIYRRVL